MRTMTCSTLAHLWLLEVAALPVPHCWGYGCAGSVGTSLGETHNCLGKIIVFSIGHHWKFGTVAQNKISPVGAL